MPLLDLLVQYGLPIGMLMIALVSGSRRVWVWSAELTACEARMEALRRAYEERLTAQRASHAQREAELAAAAERWQKLFFEMLGPITSLADVIARRGVGGAPP